MSCGRADYGRLNLNRAKLKLRRDGEADKVMIRLSNAKLACCVEVRVRHVRAMVYGGEIDRVVRVVSVRCACVKSAGNRRNHILRGHARDRRINVACWHDDMYFWITLMSNRK